MSHPQNEQFNETWHEAKEEAKAKIKGKMNKFHKDRKHQKKITEEYSPGSSAINNSIAKHYEKIGVGHQYRKEEHHAGGKFGKHIDEMKGKGLRYM